jgi:hypothetical protein
MKAIKEDNSPFGGKSVANIVHHYEHFDENEDFDKRHNPLQTM